MTINKAKHFTFSESCSQLSRDLSQKRKQPTEPQVARSLLVRCLRALVWEAETEKHSAAYDDVGVLSRCKIRFVSDYTKTAFFSNRGECVAAS